MTAVPTAPRAQTAGHAYLNWELAKGAPKPKTKHVVIELVPHGVSKNASCKGCGKELDTYGYRFKSGKSKKAPSWHPACYEPMLNLPQNYLNNSVEFHLIGLDKEAYECLTRWTKDAFNATLSPELSSFFAGEASSSDGTSLESDLGAGKVAVGATNKRKRSEKDDDEDVLALVRYGCVVTIGPAVKRVRFECGPVTKPLDIQPPRYPATISTILGVLEKKKRHVVGVAAMQMSLRS